MELIRGSEGAITSELNLWIPRARLPSAFSQAMGTARHIIRSASTGTAVVTAAIEALLAQIKRATASEMDEIVAGILALAAKVMGLLQKSFLR